MRIAQSLESHPGERPPASRLNSNKKGRAEKGRKRGREGLGRRTQGKEGMKELKLFRLKTATRRMKAGRTGAEAQRRRQNGSARGEKEEREKKGERGREPGRGTSDYVLSTVLWAEKREEEGKKERKRSERLKKRERRRR